MSCFYCNKLSDNSDCHTNQTLFLSNRGDFRTGKRLNMRKVIAYVASQFRKDKIWLRRSKPNKRDYQVMIAVDDSSSMKDNHSKQLAFESLAIISNALTLLEVGQIGISRFAKQIAHENDLCDDVVVNVNI